jgi:hypothetical protein
MVITRKINAEAKRDPTISEQNDEKVNGIFYVFRTVHA